MGKFTEYKLPLKSMPEGVHEFTYDLGKVFFKNMENEDIHDADIHVTLTVNHHGDLYEMHFTMEGTLTLLCDRCLDDLELPVDTTYDINVKYGDDYNDDSDDLLIIPESDNYLNVAYMMYDTAVLTIPIKHVHPAGKCNRAMSAMLKKHRAQSPDDEDLSLENQLIEEMDDSDTGSEENTDPRWDGLKKLRGDDN